MLMSLAIDGGPCNLVEMIVLSSLTVRRKDVPPFCPRLEHMWAHGGEKTTGVGREDLPSTYEIPPALLHSVSNISLYIVTALFY